MSFCVRLTFKFMQIGCIAKITWSDLESSQDLAGQSHISWLTYVDDTHVIKK